MQGQDKFCIKNLHTSFRFFDGTVFNSLHSGSIFYAKTLQPPVPSLFQNAFFFHFFLGFLVQFF